MLRIGELSRRVGVSDHVLRAWENRYGLLTPIRSAGGFRLYSEDDERRVRLMQARLAQGLSAAQAANAALADESKAPLPKDAVPGDAGPRPEGDAAAVLRESLDAMDEPMAHAALDRLLAELTVETVLRDVLMPYLHDLGERWQHGSIGVGNEHFASHVIRGRLSGLARGWGAGRGPYALLACPPGELHDLALMAFGIVLGRSGWRVGYLGADTPVPDVIRIAADSAPELVVLAATTPDRFTPIVDDLRRLAGIAPLALAGAGATQAVADEVGARLLAGDPVSEAALVAR
jgi:MerR family transcriptional regulator, light-induced transcriptional regulator